MRHLILVLAALSVGVTAKAQNTGRVTGTVTAAEDGHPLAGASVGVLGTNRTGFTGEGGVFLIDQVPAGTRQVRVRFLGYAPLTQTVTVEEGQTAHLNFQMVAAPLELEGMVVTAYGEQSRRDVTGAITTLNLGDLRDIPVPNPAQLLQARVAGVDVVSAGYRPGAPMNVMIRGVRSITAGNEPLYVVDGVPLVGGDIGDFNPGEIASIEVLKDASATAPYGSRGANGVILITTNRGVAGPSGATSSFSYDVQYGRQSALNFVDMMNGPQQAQQRVDAARLAGQISGQQLPTWAYDNPLVAYCALDVKTNATTGLPDTLGTTTWRAVHPGCTTGTDWQRMVYRTGNQQQHRLNYNAVSGTARLSLSGTYLDQNGITIGQGYKQYSGTVSLENTFGRLRLGATATGSRSVADIGGDRSVWGEALANSPLGAPYIDSAGNPSATLCSTCTLNQLPTGDPLRVNPLREQQAYVRQQISNRLFGSLFAELTLGRGFAYRLNFGPDVRNFSDGQFQGANTTLGGGIPIGNAQAGLLTRENFRLTLDNILTWDYASTKHKVDVTGLYSITTTRSQSDSAASKTLPYDYQLWYNLGTGSAPQPPISDYTSTALRSFMGRANYTYLNRYSFTVTGRQDCASVLAPGSQCAFFPSAGVSWQLGDEPFVKSLPVASKLISGLKLRASLGRTGNSSILPYQTEGSLSQTFYNFGSATANGYVPGQIPNPNLVWEKTTQLDVGVDFGLLNNRISGTFDVYREKTSDLLLTRSLPASTGFTSTLQNVGKTGNAGWELSVTTVNLTGRGHGPRWTTDFSFTHNQNYIISLAGGVGDDVADRWFIGQPISLGSFTNPDSGDVLHQVFYDVKMIGIWQLADSALAAQYGEKPGDIRVADLNGDGKIDGFDRVITGTTYPRLIANVYNRVTWGAFDFSFLLQGRIGYTMLDQFRIGTDLFDRYHDLNIPYWTPERCDGGPNPAILDPPAGVTAEQQANSAPGCNTWWSPSAGRQQPAFDQAGNGAPWRAPGYRIGTHWRVRNITFGYTLPASLLRKVRGVSSMRLYVEAQDPFVFTSYYGYDPENGSANGPPSYRTVLVGATLGF
jgi:TonB-linked SusC/RagA family outer membrane protein